MSNQTWGRASRGHPCPICEKHDWCLIAQDGSAAICQRIESSKVVQRPGRDRAGWLHVIRRTSGDYAFTRRLIGKPADPPPRDWREFAERCESALQPARLARLSDSLGVSAGSLESLGIGWAQSHLSFSFPMLDTEGRIVGIRLRRPNGFKFAVTGSKQGLFYASLADQITLICEGPTDTAAAMDLGFQAVGRPSCNGGMDMLLAVLKTMKAPIVVAADADKPGQAGAKALARRLLRDHFDVRLLTPPVKDLREWKRQGVSAEDVIQSARRVEVKVVARIAS